MLRFRSKMDPWLLVTMAVGAVVPTISVGAALSSGGSPFLLIIPVLTVGFTAWTIAGTSYDVEDGTLVVRCGPFHRRIPLHGIREVRRTRSARSAAALSLDRLAIQHDDGTVVVSPRDRAGFIAAVRSRVPDVRVHDTGPPVDIRIGWLLLLIPTFVIAVVGIMLFRQRSPLDVTLTPQTLSIGGAYGVTLDVTDIRTVSLEPAVPPLHKSRGFSSPTTLRGRFRHATLGAGDVFVRLDLPPYILARTRDGFLVFNMDDPTRTRQVYAELQRRVADH